MKRIAMLALVLLALATLTAAQNQKFETFYDAPAFSAQFANDGSAVTYASQVLDSKVGKLTQNMYEQTFAAGKGTIIVGYVDRPAGSRFDVEASVDGMLAKLPDEKELKPRFNAALGKLASRGAAAAGVFGEGEKAVKVAAFVRAAADDAHIWSIVFLCMGDNTCSEADASTFFSGFKVK